ncbi:P-loop containing nucleoside triphosphate hydrolase protein [Phyllosticta capitalensis]
MMRESVNETNITTSRFRKSLLFKFAEILPAIARAELRWKLKKHTKPPISKGFSDRHVLFVRRVYNQRMKFDKTIIQVNGRRLRNALRNMFQETKGFGLTKDQNTEVSSRGWSKARSGSCYVRSAELNSQLEDVRFLYWAKPELELLSTHYQSVQDTESLSEIKVGLQFIHTEWSQMQLSLNSLLPSSITFEYLWAIFPPHCLIVGKDDLDSTSIWRVSSIVLEQSSRGAIRFIIMADFIEWDGEHVGMASKKFVIIRFTGSFLVADLPCVPLRYHPRASAIIEEVLKRNEKKFKHCRRGFQIRNHKGFASISVENDQKSNEKDRKLLKHHYQGRVIVDPKMMHEAEPNNTLWPTLKTLRKARVFRSEVAFDEKEILNQLTRDPDVVESDRVKPDPGLPVIHGDLKTTLTQEQRLLLSGVTFGYFLGDAKWAAFSIDCMSNFEWNTTVFDSLVMDENLKDIIYRLVKAHTSLCPGFDDFIKGKGRGLIGLLQGPPGSGKTLTAEAIAETAEKPLYVVSSGALGSAPGEIHQNLTNILRLAAHWGAVLLLDEADVFLAKRNLVDLNRNAIVSVFLRELEYYQGILLLTTNQAQIIDDAFQSRMHFFHSYPSLDFSARKRIWQDFIARAQGNQTDIHVDVDETGIEKLAKLRLNGRQVSFVQKSVGNCI